MGINRDAVTHYGNQTMASGAFSVDSVSAAITAAGTTIDDATALTAAVNMVTTAASGTGVKLPDAPIGAEVVVQNKGANDLEVYPHSGTGVLNSASAGGAVTLAAATDQTLVAKRVSATTWIALVGAGPAT